MVTNNPDGTSNADGEVLINPNYNSDPLNCDEKNYFANSFLNLLISLEAEGQLFNTSGYNLSSNTTYTSDAFLGPFLGDTSWNASWKFISSTTTDPNKFVMTQGGSDILIVEFDSDIFYTSASAIEEILNVQFRPNDSADQIYDNISVAVNMAAGTDDLLVPMRINTGLVYKCCSIIGDPPCGTIDTDGDGIFDGAPYIT